MISYNIAFYIQLLNSKKALQNANIDFGNPGVGGTQYLFLLTVKYLNKIYGPNYAVLLTDGEMGLNDLEIPIAYAADEHKAVCYCEEHKISALVFNANVLDRIKDCALNTNVRLILWAHNTLNRKRQQIAAKTPSIDRIVCVSQSQYQNMSDTPCFEKCIYINNVIPAAFYNSATITDYSEPIVVYVGSIMPQKGVHNLLEMWKYVERYEPEAQLYIFGGSNVWNPKASTESNSIADKYYSRIIRKRIRRLKNPENVHFMGARGWTDISRMISTARVGVVNPSHYMRDETFCMSAIEMETHGIPVVSRQRNDGLQTTIQQGTSGFLEKRDKEIALRISFLLKDDSACKKIGLTARKSAKRFLVEEEVGKWHSLVEYGKLETISLRKKKIISKDVILLQHDFFLKIGFLIESGKIIDLFLKKLNGDK